MTEQKVTLLKKAEKPFLPLAGFFTVMAVLLAVQLIFNLGISIWNEMRYFEDAMAEDMSGGMSLLQGAVNLLVIPVTIIIAAVCFRSQDVRYEARVRRLLLLWTGGYLWMALCQPLVAGRYIIYTLLGGDVYGDSLGYGSVLVFTVTVALTLLFFVFWMMAEHPFYLGATVTAAVLGIAACLTLPAPPMSAQELVEASTVSIFLEACSTNIHYLLITVASVGLALHLRRARKSAE